MKSVAPRRSGTRNPGGITPTTSYGSPPNRTTAPSISGAASYRLLHTSSLSTTTRAPPGTSSSGRNARPSVGWIPTTRKKSSVTRSPRTSSGISAAPSSVAQTRSVDTPSKARLCSRMYSNLYAVSLLLEPRP